MPPVSEAFFKNHFLLGDYLKFNFSSLTVAKINTSLIGAKFFNFFRQRDLFAIDIIALLITYGTAELKTCNTTEDLSAGTCFRTNFQWRFCELSDHIIDLSEHRIFFLLLLFHFLSQLFHIAGVCFHGEFAWKKKIAGISI